MGIKSTFTISRHVAEEIITKKIMTDISELSDQQLAGILEYFPESDYRNYCIREPFGDDKEHAIEDFYDFKYKL